MHCPNAYMLHGFIKNVEILNLDTHYILLIVKHAPENKNMAHLFTGSLCCHHTAHLMLTVCTTETCSIITFSLFVLFFWCENKKVKRVRTQLKVHSSIMNLNMLWTEKQRSAVRPEGSSKNRAQLYCAAALFPKAT